MVVERKGREGKVKGMMRVDYIGEGEGTWFDLLLFLFFLSFFFARSSLSRRML